MLSNLHIKKGTHLYLSLGSVNRDKFATLIPQSDWLLTSFT
jgi:hypothetical protein